MARSFTRSREDERIRRVFVRSGFVERLPLSLRSPLLSRVPSLRARSPLCLSARRDRSRQFAVPAIVCSVAVGAVRNKAPTPDQQNGERSKVHGLVERQGRGTAASSQRVSLTTCIMATAVFLTLMRVFAPFEIGKDQAVQLEAARRLVSGLGLTSTYFVSHSSDVSQRPTPKVLTWWPPGFSLIAAAFMWISLSLATGLRVVYGAVTLVCLPIGVT